MRLDIESKVWISFDETKLHFFDPASGISAVKRTRLRGRYLYNHAGVA